MQRIDRRGMTPLQERRSSLATEDPDGVHSGMAEIAQPIQAFSILLLPGLGDSGPAHWHTHWEATFGYERVIQEDWDTPRLDDWMACLHERIVADQHPKVLIAHSLACCLVAHWSRAHDNNMVAGALLVAPSDVEGPNYPTGTVGFAPMPLHRLRFPSIVAASSNDPYISVERARQFAQAWGADYRLLGEREHIGSAAGLGPWSEGHDLLMELCGPRHL